MECWVAIDSVLTFEFGTVFGARESINLDEFSNEKLEMRRHGWSVCFRFRNVEPEVQGFRN